jgi:YbbR domain-containing protein
MEEQAPALEYKIAKYRINRKAFTFLMCLALSVFFWVLMTLSKTYTISVNFPAKYIRLPPDKIVSNKLPETIEIEISSSGFKLLRYKFLPVNQVIDVDVKNIHYYNTTNSYYLLTSNCVNKVTKQFEDKIKVLKINPDTLFFNFNKKISKIVPIKHSIQLSFEKQYHLSKAIVINPSKITISGASDIIKKIDTLETEAQTFNNVSKSFTTNLQIANRPKFQQIETSNSVIEAKINVTKFTEGNLFLPLEVLHLPSKVSLKTFPDKVEIKYQVALEDYDKVNASQFRLVLDYNKIEKGNNKVKITLQKSSPYVRLIKLASEKVEYIIRK